MKINYPNKKYVTFYDNVMQVVNENDPLKKLSNREIKRKKKPWITKGIITSIHKRNFYLKRFRKQITNSSLSDTNATEIR